MQQIGMFAKEKIRKRTDATHGMSADATAIFFPLKERIRGEVSSREVAAERKRYLLALENIRSAMLSLRQSFGTRTYLRGNATVALHVWSAKQDRDYVVPQVRWYWQSPAFNSGKKFYMMQPFVDTLVEKGKPGHAFLTDFFQVVRGTELLDSVIAFEIARVELNLRRQHCRQIVIALDQLLRTTEIRKTWK